MFAENLLESGVIHHDSRRRWATLVSVSVQLSAVAVLALLPSLYPEIMAIGRPKAQSVPIFSQAPPVQQPINSDVRASGSQFSRPIEVANPSLTLGSARHDVDPGPVMPPNVRLGPAGTNFISSLIVGSVPPVLKPTPPPNRPLIVSHMDEGQLLLRVQPNYPIPAKAAGIEGQVTLAAIIGKAGDIESLRVISGHPLLAGAARDAVSQWRYRPYILNGEPIEVETQITVNFKLRN
ncbi:MAG: outer rane transport energization protein TonB [Acidobacteriales bacterium]|nr:outer rane transport energization protein TonB [Terriglobales bacterium]